MSVASERPSSSQLSQFLLKKVVSRVDDQLEPDWEVVGHLVLAPGVLEVFLQLKEADEFVDQLKAVTGPGPLERKLRGLDSGSDSVSS